VSDLIKADARAVRALSAGVTRYADRLRAAAAAARQEMAAAQQAALDAADRQRSRLNRATEDLQQAKAAAASAPEDRRAELQRVVAAAQQHFDQARQDLDRARQAGKNLADASHDLLKTLQAAEATVAGQSSAAASILASLDGKLAEITSGSFGSVVRHALATAGTAAQLAVATMDVSKLAGNVSQGMLPTADHVTSTAQLTDLEAGHQQQLWRESKEHERD
jgi:chromosome segregation ATPase